MYDCSEETRELFKKRYRQVARIYTCTAVPYTENKTLLATESNVLENGLTIDRYCFPSGDPKIGAGIAASLSLKLDNRRGAFDNVSFNEMVLYVEIGTKDWSDPETNVEWIPCGVFVVTSIVRKTGVLNISAYDLMCRFDKNIDFTYATFPMTVGEVIDYCCHRCGVTTDYDTSAAGGNRDVLINDIPQSDITYRKLMSDCAFTLGQNLLFDPEGVLKFTHSIKTSISGAIRFKSDGTPSTDYTIYGAEGGVGDKTENLIPLNAEWVDGFVNADGEIAELTNSPKTSPMIEVMQGEKYLFRRFPSFEGGWLAARAISFYSSDEEFISRTYGLGVSAITATAPEGAAYARLSYCTYGETVNELMFIQSDVTPTEYVPGGYVITIHCGASLFDYDVTKIYVEKPIFANETLSYSDTGVAIPTINGTNIMEVVTEIEPIGVRINNDIPILSLSDRYYSEINDVRYTLRMLRYTFSDGNSINKWGSIQPYDTTYDMRESNNTLFDTWYSEGTGDTPEDKMPDNLNIAMIPTYGDWTLRPFDVISKPMLYVFPFDEIGVIKDGGMYALYVTNVVIGLNRNTQLSNTVSPTTLPQ